MNSDEDDIVQRSSFLRFLSPENYERVRPLLREERFEFGESIVKQGDPADALYILVSGRARVVKRTEKGDELALASLRPGDEFGEQALLGEVGTRGATVRCSTSVEVLRLARDDIEPLLENHPELLEALEKTARYRTLHGFLYEFSNFGRLPARALRDLIDCMRPVEFARGETIIGEGDPPGPMYVVESGRARAYKGEGRKERNLAFYRESDFFGELSILNGSPRAATVAAVTDCKLLALEPDAVRDLEQRYPEFQHLLRERLAQYEAGTEARVPLDFATEVLPAEALAQQHRLDTDTSEGEVLEGERGRKRRKRRIRRFPHVPQVDEMDCGAACLAMICRHYGRKVSLPRIRQLCHTSLDGTSLKGICHAANELGLSARALKVSRRNLDEMPLPAIVHWEGNHWIVLYQVDRKHVMVADPASTCRSIPREEFEAEWSGYSALFDYTEAFEQAPLAQPVLRRFLPYVTRHGKSIFQALFLSVVVTFLELLFPVFTQVVVDKVIVEGDIGLLNTVLMALAATLIFSQVAGLVQQYLLAFVAVRVDAGILDMLTRQMLSLPMSYFNSRRTGDIQRRLDGAEQVRSFIVDEGIGGLLAIITLAGTLPLMALYSPLLLGVFLITVPLYFGLMLWSKKVLKPLFADIEESQGKYASHQIDAIKGIEAVKASAAEQSFRDAMLNEFLSVARKMFRSNFIMMTYDAVLEAIGLISTILFLYFGALQVMAGNLTVGGFMAFSSLTGIAYGAIQGTLGIWDQWQFISVLLNRLGDIFEQEPEQGRDRSHLVPVHSLEGHIELRKVGFRYGGPEAPSILADLDLEIPHGRMVAIVGRSGSGKTTLIKLLAGLIEPTEGTILFDRMDLRKLNYRDVRRHIGMVLQDNHMFSDTITNNIAFGEPEPDFDRVLWCTQVASAHDFIMRLPMGYETKVGESGISISGGQKQRIAIARALYHDPPILIFDEATSALDTESERAIQDNLERMMVGRTSIVIAHRLSTVRDADLIVVLEQGSIAELGSHDELMAQRGLYFHLSSQQLGI